MTPRAGHHQYRGLNDHVMSADYGIGEALPRAPATRVFRFIPLTKLKANKQKTKSQSRTCILFKRGNFIIMSHASRPAAVSSDRVPGGNEAKRRRARKIYVG